MKLSLLSAILIFLFSLSAGAEPEKFSVRHTLEKQPKFMAALGGNYDTYTHKTGTLYLGLPRLADKGQDVVFLGLGVNDRGYSLEVGQAHLSMGGGIKYSIGLQHSQFEDIPADRDNYLTAKGSVIFMGAEVGLGLTMNHETTYGQAFIGFILPLYPWEL